MILSPDCDIYNDKRDEVKENFECEFCYRYDTCLKNFIICTECYMYKECSKNKMKN